MLRQRTWSCCQPRSESWFARCDDSRHALETGTARCGPPRSCSRAMVSIEACARSKTVDCAVCLWASSSMGFSGCVNPRTSAWTVPPSRYSCVTYTYIHTLRPSATAAPDLNLSHTEIAGIFPKHVEISRFNPGSQHTSGRRRCIQTALHLLLRMPDSRNPRQVCLEI
jgi:hypothetical protein